MLDVVRSGEICPVIGTCLILLLIGQMYADEQQKRWGGLLGLACFIAYGVYVLLTTPPQSAPALFNLTVACLGVFGLTLGLSWITLPIIVGVARRVHQQMKAAAEVRRRVQLQVQKEKQERERQEMARRIEEERRQQELSVVIPPEPTREELLRAAQERYDSTLALLASASLDDTERKAAQEQAKQRYLRELDEIMK
jgi:hypothetical protein